MYADLAGFACILVSLFAVHGHYVQSIINIANFTELWLHAEEHLLALRKWNGTEVANVIDFRLWTYNGTLTGCGLQYRAVGNESHVGSVYFPKVGEHQCGDDLYTMRTTPPNRVYADRVRLAPGEHPVQIELIADGFEDTYVDRLCVGFSGAGYRPRAFCVDNELLRACKQLTDNWKAIDLDRTSVLLNQKTRGTEKMIFRDVESLAAGLERLARNRNDGETRWAVCGRIDLIRGTVNDELANHHCIAEKSNIRYHMSNYMVPYSTSEIKTESKDPNKCFPVV
ncbi:Hypothetical protein CINCED_3A014091 [Cinara cedri]|uniref:Uncharacterized protein n=1 Tax=Cinara cedri TaxID=506608 RepID=A0A5E4MVC3_9HEMI|nr:Hypothetical protein CINCED_3A014091 [Cinara cedri]